MARHQRHRRLRLRHHRWEFHPPLPRTIDCRLQPPVDARNSSRRWTKRYAMPALITPLLRSTGPVAQSTLRASATSRASVSRAPHTGMDLRIGRCADRKRIWMSQGENTTFVQYTFVRGSNSLEMDLKVLVNYRDFHSSTSAGEWRMKIEPVQDGVKISPLMALTPFYLRSSGAQCEPRHEWYHDCFQPREKETRPR